MPTRTPIRPYRRDAWSVDPLRRVAGRLRQSHGRVLLPVPGDVQRGHVQETGIVPEQSESVVASLTQQPSDCASGMVMIKVLRLRIATDRAPVVLRGPHPVDGGARELVATIEVGRAV